MDAYSFDRPEADVEAVLDRTSEQVVSPLLFGDNLEHTRACISGGLSAEILKNRKFVGHSGRYGCANGWYPIGEKTFFSFGTEEGWLSAGRSYTRHGEGYRMHRRLERNAQYVTNFAATRGGIGQKDLYVRGGVPCECTAAVRASTETKLTVSLLAGDGRVYDSAAITARAGDYKEYTVLLTPDRDDPEARLEIASSSPGTVMIGAVSLLPPVHRCFGLFNPGFPLPDT